MALLPRSLPKVDFQEVDLHHSNRCGTAETSFWVTDALGTIAFCFLGATQVVPTFLVHCDCVLRKRECGGIVSFRPKVPILPQSRWEERLRGGCLGDLYTHHKTTNHGPTYSASLQRGL